MDGYQYEHKCASLLKSRGFKSVKVTQASGDQGVDIFAYKNGKKYGIQCKYYTSPVGNKSVQEAYAGAKYYNCDVAAVLTNSTFTKSAKDLAKKTHVLLWDKNNVPFGESGFRLTKILGYIMIAISLLNLCLMPDDAKYPFLQKVIALFSLIGGIFNVFETGQFTEVIASCVYLCISASCVISGVFAGEFPSDLIVFYLLASGLSFLRYRKLLKQENTVKNTTKRKELAKTELEKEIKEALNNYGSVYVEILSEKLGVPVTLIKTIHNDHCYQLTYHASEPVTHKLYLMQTEFNDNLKGTYIFKSLSECDFVINVYENSVS